MWYIPGDDSAPVFDARDQIFSAHRDCHLTLPKTAILFFMSRGVDYLCENTDAKLLPELFPRFLGRCPIWEIEAEGICFLDGGRGAPQACDTVETLGALGVENIVAVGMFGAYDPKVQVGEILSPEKVFIEEGTSLHYYESIEYTEPDEALLKMTKEKFGVSTYPIVSTDAVFRQTYRKEQLWREKGAVGVDMETSAVFSVSRYLGMRAVGLLMASDLHPLYPGAPKWEWHMTKEMRDTLTEKSLMLARLIAKQLFGGQNETDIGNGKADPSAVYDGGRRSHV